MQTGTQPAPHRSLPRECEPHSMSPDGASPGAPRPSTFPEAAAGREVPCLEPLQRSAWSPSAAKGKSPEQAPCVPSTFRDHWSTVSMVESQVHWEYK